MAGYNFVHDVIDASNDFYITIRSIKMHIRLWLDGKGTTCTTNRKVQCFERYLIVANAFDWRHWGKNKTNFYWESEQIIVNRANDIWRLDSSVISFTISSRILLRFRSHLFHFLPDAFICKMKVSTSTSSGSKNL